MKHIERNAFEIEVAFSETQQAEQKRQAEARQAPKSQNPGLVKDKRISGIGNVKMHRIGLLGEHGYSAVTGTLVDNEHGLCGKRWDFVEFGKRIEVKTLQGYLAFNNMFKADVAVLAIHEPGRFDKVWVQGWIPQAEFEAKHFTTNFGYGDRLCVEPKDLFPMATLKFYCFMAQEFNRVLRGSR